MDLQGNEVSTEACPYCDKPGSDAGINPFYGKKTPALTVSTWYRLRTYLLRLTRK
ncbi:hypothetical protein DPMN_092551 [Dreissena polymorpha]|uniref:Uncharacterized protein n=1 Tax=Dreissena polymorpha TaxID=45954 RepID=A0A9D4L1J4_DREPO|nr:hypothetical protein DPMN_092551 [Dreissena polymorpha]